MAEHRVELVQRIDALAKHGGLHAHGEGDLGHLVVCFRQEFVQRRIEQADRHRQAVHDGEEAGEIEALHRQQLVERQPPALLIDGEDHLAHHMDALALEEHVLGAAKADAFGAEGAGGERIGLSVSALVRTVIRRARSAQPMMRPKSPDSANWIIGTSPFSTWLAEPSMVMISPFLRVTPMPSSRSLR